MRLMDQPYLITCICQRLELSALCLKCNTLCQRRVQLWRQRSAVPDRLVQPHACQAKPHVCRTLSSKYVLLATLLALPKISSHIERLSTPAAHQITGHRHAIRSTSRAVLVFCTAA